MSLPEFWLPSTVASDLWICSPHLFLIHGQISQPRTVDEQTIQTSERNAFEHENWFSRQPTPPVTFYNWILVTFKNGILISWLFWNSSLYIQWVGFIIPYIAQATRGEMMVKWSLLKWVQKVGTRTHTNVGSKSGGLIEFGSRKAVQFVYTKLAVS